MSDIFTVAVAFVIDVLATAFHNGCSRENARPAPYGRCRVGHIRLSSGQTSATALPGRLQGQSRTLCTNAFGSGCGMRFVEHD